MAEQSHHDLSRDQSDRGVVGDQNRESDLLNQRGLDVRGLRFKGLVLRDCSRVKAELVLSLVFGESES